MSTLLDLEPTMSIAAVFAVLHVVFTLRVGGYRFSNNISLGDGGDKELLNRIRGHGNFIEQVPIALVLLLLNDLNGLSDTAIYSLGGVLLISRIVHYLMITTRSLPMMLRPLSMLGTLGTILVSAFLLVY